MFPQVYGGHIWVIVGALAMLVAYFVLTVAAARERPD
jgi:nitrate/nitrite transporter NarK